MPQPSRIPRLAVFLFYAGMALVALGWGWLRGEPGVLFVGEARIVARWLPEAPWRPWVEGILLGTLVATAAALVSRLMHAYFRWARVLARELAIRLGPLTLLDVAYLALLSGVAEEMLFRGALQPQVGYVLASLVFGFVHLLPDRRFLPWTASALLMGFVLGGLLELTGNIIAPITAHMLVNFLNLLQIRRVGPLFGVTPEGAEDEEGTE